MRIFVYGTLKAGKPRNFYITREGGRLIGRATTAPKYRLVKQWFSDYPSMIEGDSAVEGELWEITEKTLEALDSVEGVNSNLFKRASIEMSDGDKVLGYVSVNKPYPYRTLISGRWE